VSLRGRPFEALPAESEQPGFTLEVNGAPVRARALGARIGGKPGLDFHFDPRPLLRRHPSGFEAAILKDGREIRRIKASGPEAVKAIQETLACDRELRLTGRIDPYRR
jgi:hypothetical protein